MYKINNLMQMLNDQSCASMRLTTYVLLSELAKNNLRLFEQLRKMRFFSFKNWERIQNLNRKLIANYNSNRDFVFGIANKDP